MYRRIAAALALLAALAVAGAGHAQDYSPAARRVLLQARAASGGRGWDMLRGWHETGRQNGAPYERWVDIIVYGLRMQTDEPAGRRIHGFNGAGDWEISPQAATIGLADKAIVARARTEAFFDAHAFFYPGRYAARGDNVRIRREGTSSFDVVDVQPLGGHTRELWFDQRTHLLARTVDRSQGPPVTTQFLDYRRVGPVMAPFQVTVDTGLPAQFRDRRVDRLSFERADRNLFSLPRSAGLAPPAPR